MSINQSLHRRRFLKITSLSGAALMLGFYGKEALSKKSIVNITGAAEGLELTPFIVIDPSGQVTILSTRPEMGQGTFQAIPALIAEELEVPFDNIRIRQSGGEKWHGSTWDQASGGSSSVRESYMPMRKIGAAARQMLVTAASQQWQVPEPECYAAVGKVHHRPSGKSLDYGELVAAASKLEVPKEPKLKDPKDFTILGKSVARPDIPLKASGRAVFGIDAEVPGMVYASVERCPVLGSKLISYHDADALKIKGVQQVVKAQRDLGKNKYIGVAVIADNYWAALQGRKALQVKWDHQGLDAFQSKTFEQSLRTAAKKEGVMAHEAGHFDTTYAEAPVKVTAFYETPMVTHSPMEPMNCLAHWQPGDKVEIWTSTQGPGIIKEGVAKALTISPDNVTVHTLFNGGGFGRRLSADFATEAALLSKTVGKPVKVIWTREDDTQLGPFRPLTFSALKGGLTAQGTPIAFQHKVIAPSIDATTNDTYDTTKADGTMVEGISDQAYEIPHMKNSYVFAETHIPLTYWRSVTSSTLAFAHECFIDEMAVKAATDPLAFRIAMLTKDSDTKRVLTALKKVSNWDQPLPKGSGRGIAQWDFFAGLCGQVVEVTKLPAGGVKVYKVYAVIDVGTVVNPDNVKAQVEGAIVMALVAATKDAITFENGQAVQTNFHNNRMVRIHEMPEIEVHILAEGGSKIKGVGEPGLPPFAPALANAVYAATGKRIRKLPFDLTAV